MPAIQLARLRLQAAQVAENFSDPGAFVKSLHTMLENYADRTLRPGQIASPITVLQSYHVPPPVLRQVELEIGKKIDVNPAYTMELAETLWNEAFFETQLLATRLLGRIDPDNPRLFEKLASWGNEVREAVVRESLLTTSLSRLRKERPEKFLKLVSGWLNPNRQKFWPNGIQALIPLIEDPDFLNIPAVYEIVRPAVSEAPPILQKDLEALLIALFAASPVETVFFLREVVDTNPQALVVYRRIRPNLPPDLRNALKDVLKKNP